MDEHVAAARRLLRAPATTESGVVDALFRHERTVEAENLRAGIGAAAVDALLALGLIRATGTGFVGTARLARFGGQLVASDRVGYRNHAGFVLGPGPATATLADVVRPLERGRALDLGCGPGSLALWLAGKGMDAVGVDISERALSFADFNRRLNALPRVTFRKGDFLTAPPDEALDGQFDLCVANPPFVLAPKSALVYRDAPLQGDETTRVTLERVRRALAPGGRGYMIGNWADDGRGRWDARPRAWLRSLRGPSLVTRISSLAPDAYVHAWTRDLDAATRESAADHWPGFLRSQGIARITTGVIAIASSDRTRWRNGAIHAIEASRPGWRAVEALLAGR